MLRACGVCRRDEQVRVRVRPLLARFVEKCSQAGTLEQKGLDPSSFESFDGLRRRVVDVCGRRLVAGGHA
jgi:hypothetical protein